MVVISDFESEWNSEKDIYQSEYGEESTIARIYAYHNNRASIHAISKMIPILTRTVLGHHQDTSTGAYNEDLLYHKIMN